MLEKNEEELPAWCYETPEKVEQPPPFIPNVTTWQEELKKIEQS